MIVGFRSGQSNIMNVYRINESSAARNSNRNVAQVLKVERKDIVTISPQGRLNNLLKNLMKQKEDIKVQKNSLINSTLESGGTLDTIESRLEHYDEMMKSVDDKIAEILANEMENRIEKPKKQEDSALKTKEEIQNERLANIADLSSDFKQTKVIHSVQTRVNGDARVLESEIELDKVRAGASTKAKEMIAKKEATLADIKEKSLELTSQVACKISDIVEKTNDNNKLQETVLPENCRDDEMNLTDMSSIFIDYKAIEQQLNL